MRVPAGAGRLGFGQQPQDAGVIFFGVVQTVGDAAQVQLKCRLGNVEAGVEDGGVVLTHACLMRAPARCRPCGAQSTVRVWSNGWKGRGLLDAARPERRLPAARAAPRHHRRAGCKPARRPRFLPPALTGSATSISDIQAAISESPDPPTAAEPPHRWPGAGRDARARRDFGASREWGLAIGRSPLLVRQRGLTRTRAKIRVVAGASVAR